MAQVGGLTEQTVTLGRPSDLDRLTVVMPVFNERANVLTAVTAARAAASAAGIDLTFLIVDDGGTDEQSTRVLRQLDRAPDVEVVFQRENRGRFAARAAGLARVSTEYVLLLDARVELDPSSLAALRLQIEDHSRRVWNFDVEPSSRTPFALFWTGITKVWWNKYFREREHVAFTDVDFDRYPKGTTAFFAPTVVIEEAMRSFSSLFDDERLASDDTRLLREIARRTPINISPEVLCHHRVKGGARSWANQCRYRGTTFVDGYLDSGTDARRALIALAIAATMGLAWVFPRPRRAVHLACGASLGAAGLTAWAGGTRREVVSVLILTAPFGALFGSGFIRGLLMAVRRR